ncbi:FRIGIDA-like protein 3 [Arachis duranensis]|uniref:FRIGIDA-like protein n=1 Tax=Arachis duranensis TaxID=130453 RepID=A0A6P4CAR1_ARADU|nr:FRIGIDA-like protein 3 [Arachis duranensis]
MEDTDSVATLIDSTSSKIKQLQKAFAELESYRAVTLNLKWKELEEHFHGLEKSLKRRFHELEDQEKEFENKVVKSREILEKREATVCAKEQASLQKLQDKRDAAVFAIFNVKLSPEGGNVDLLSYPELVKLCKEMDARGLHKFISDNRKNLAAIRDEIPHALGAAPNAACLVLDSLEGFYCAEASNQDVKKDANLLGLRRTCIMLMECLYVFLNNSDGVYNELLEDIKDRAKAVAEEWKPRLDALDADAGNGNSLEAHAFLQLLASFDIASDFNEEEFSRFIPMVSRRRQTADLCRCLGLSEKMPGVIEVLVNSGRQIDAVNLSFAFNLTEQFSPTDLLKSYLKDAKKAASPSRCVNSSPTTQVEVNERELVALKSIIKCIEEHKLEEQYPLDPLMKRVVQLEKAKADKKRETEATKPQPKRPRANGVGYGPRVSNFPSDKASYPRAADRYPQYVFDRPYVYPGPTDNHCPPLMGSTTYNFTPSHSNYFGNGYQYQPTYLH